MSFTGKATYSAGVTLPELAEDVSDVISIVSPFETPLLDVLGDSLRAATSTHHEWLEDTLLPNKDAINDGSILDGETETAFDVAGGDRFRAGDQIQVTGSKELMLVTDVSSNTLNVIRGYAGTTAEEISNGQELNILGNAALEGGDRPTARFTNRTRCGNFTQIFTAAAEVSGSDLAASQLGLADEMDYQKAERLRELLRDLENTVINGGAPAANPQGSGTIRRTMKGVLAHLATNVFNTGDTGFPTGDTLDEDKINYVLRKIWENSNGNVDTIVVGGFQKRKINAFLSAVRGYSSGDTTYRDGVSAYESDFGLCRIVTTRWMPQDAVMLLDSSRVNVL
ncbi:MAG: SU10 major capsid protein, partial [Planctomycetota bacterium]